MGGDVWRDGRWQGARQLFSPNYAARPDGGSVDLVVIHNISLPPFEYGSDAVERLFTNSLEAGGHPFFSAIRDLRVSSHFLIRRGGEAVQFVSCNDMAYHAGVSSFSGRDGCNRFSVGIELEGCDFEPFARAQYLTLHRLLAALHGRYPIRAVCGHSYIAPDRKSDPGHFFDWDEISRWGFCAAF